MYATPKCARCDKAVYAAEQVLGPGRKYYHRPCLACTLCNKRLDSYSLLEHNEQPYCKPCHLKSFGTTDLRHANLPTAPRVESTPTQTSPPPSPIKPTMTGPSTPLRPAVTGPTTTPYRASPLKPSMTGSPRFTAMATPKCAACDKPVYHAEMVRALSRPYHRPCLRCPSCRTTLDPARLTEHDGVPMCTRCHSKEHGRKYIVASGGR